MTRKKFNGSKKQIVFYILFFDPLILSIKSYFYKAEIRVN